MGDEFDGCECVWSHEFAMQRLLAFIRQSQSHCTDTECIDVSGRLQQHAPMTPTGGEGGNFVMMTMLTIFAVIMYLVLPDSIMKLRSSKRRSALGQDPHGDGSPPPPPPPAPPAVN